MSASRRQVIIGTAGHVDHGKTALIKALTGIDADTLEEEKRRGITIELGFVFMECPPDMPQIVFIDVPGHERLIRTMVAGASSLQAALLVVAADEGIQPQTAEHCDILRLLGVERGIVALTKCDLVDPDAREEVSAEVTEFLGTTSLAGAPVIPVSAQTGEGLDELRRALYAVAGEVPSRADSGAFRLPVDRVFTLHGFGTVVAGTVLSGALQAGDQVVIYPEQTMARVRGIQVHGHAVETAGVGQRVALNLPDLRKEDLRRGQCAAAPGSLSPTTRLDVTMRLLGQTPFVLKSRGRVRVHVGTEEVIGSVVLMDRNQLTAGEEAPAQILLESPTVALHGDRFVVRTLSPLHTVGGGVVLDPLPEKHRRRAAATLQAFERLEGDTTDVVQQAFLKSAGQPLTPAQVAASLGLALEKVAEACATLVEAGQLVRIRTDAQGGADEAQALYLHAQPYQHLATHLDTELSVYFQANRYRVHMPAAQLQARMLELCSRPVLVHLLRDLRRQGHLLVTERGFGLPDRALPFTAAEKEQAEHLEALYLETGVAPPAEETARESLEIPPAVFANLVTALLDQGLLVRLPGKVTIHAASLLRAEQIVRGTLQEQGETNVGALRDTLGCSRKHAVALLEHFDAVGLTRRVGDNRVPGPKFSGEV